MRLLLLLSALLTALVGTGGTASAGAVPRQQLSAQIDRIGVAATATRVAARRVVARPHLADVLQSVGVPCRGRFRAMPIYADRLRV